MTSDRNIEPCQILFRSKDAVEIYTIDESRECSEQHSRGGTLVKGYCSIHTFSPDGDKVLLHMPSVGVMMSAISRIEDIGKSIITKDTTPFLKNSKGVSFFKFSTRGSFLLTWERPIKSTDDSAPPPNLKIWSGITGEYFHGFSMRSMKRDQWPPIKWSHDEKLAFHMVTNEIHVYDGDEFTKDEVRFKGKIRCKGIGNFSLPKSSIKKTTSLPVTEEERYLLTAFVPETKGKPARINLLRFPDKCGTAENSSSGPLLTSKSFYQAEECIVKWSPKGDAALILTHTSIDSSGESYYGSANLYLLLSENSKLEGEAISVPLPNPGKEPNAGPVLDVSWMPDADKPSCFAVIAGRMPALASLHNGTTGEANFLFGNSHRNTIVWSEHGRFLILGGFGNLAGGMDFFDKNKLKAIPQYDPVTGKNLGSTGNIASCAVGYGWSPSSRYFMVSTTSPRMNVDNGVQLFKYNGLELPSTSPIVSWNNMKYQPDKLLSAEFVPSKKGIYPDRAQSPPPKAGNDRGPASSLNTLKTGNSSVAYKPPASRYVPPGARKSGAGMNLADRMRKEREGSTVGATKVVKKGIVGASTVEVKSKNVIRRERQRLAKQKAEAEQKEEAEKKVQEEKEKASANAEDPVKRAKKIKKLLKQIDEMKKKDLISLNEDQKKKVAAEDDLRKELSGLSM